MVQDSLVRYVREQIRAGYDSGSIKNYLLKYGYSERRINSALQAAYPPTEVKHVVHFSKTTITLIIAVVCSLVIISAAAFMFLDPRGPPQLLDVQVDLVSDSIELGGELGFTAEIFNLGKARRYDVSLRYEIYGLNDELIKFKEETIALETRASSSVNIALGNTLPGNYYLRATAFYGDKTARATSSFRIVKKEEKQVPLPIVPTVPTVPPPETPPPETPTQTCPVSCNDANECTSDYCNGETGYLCKHDKIYSCCGNDICETGEDYNNCLADCEVPVDSGDDIFEGKNIWEKLDMIKNIAENDKGKALAHCNGIEQSSYRYECISGVAVSSGDDNLCSNIEDDSYKDNCYKESATTSKNNEICAKVAKDSKRDQCYMDFATKGDYSVCDKLVNKYLKQSCDSLRQLSEVQV